MEKKSKMLIASSIITLLAAGGISVGVTAALFTQTGAAKIHIEAGSLDVGFYLTSLKYDQLDPSTGLILDEQNVDLKAQYESAWDETEQAVDLAKLSTTTIVVSGFYPTMTGIATFKVVNKADIAINSKLSYSVSGTFAPSSSSAPRESMSEGVAEAHMDTEFLWLNEEDPPETFPPIKTYLDPCA